MKFYKFQKYFSKLYWMLLPTVVLNCEDPIFDCHNFAIEFHFLMFHMRWLWLEEGR